MTRDLLHAARSLAKDRAFTFVCVASLGIGIGALIALVTFTRGVMAPARGIDTDGLVELLVVPEGPLRSKAGVWALDEWSYPDYEALRSAALGVAITGWTRRVSEIGDPSASDDALPRATTLYVSTNYFSTVGVSLARGPGFDPTDDDATSAEPRVVLSHDYWQTRAGADPDVVGTSITIDSISHLVVGIAPDGFQGHFHYFDSPSALLFVPLDFAPRLLEQPALRFDRTAEWLRIYGRLDPGVSLRDADRSLTAFASGLAREYPATNEFKAATVQPYYSQDAVDGPTARAAVSVMLGLAGVVLLIVCLNVSGMMLVRGMRRERELCIREALGAGRRRLIQYLFFEALLLAGVGGGLSAFVLFGIPATVAWWLDAPVPEEFDLDAVGLALSSGLCLLVSLLFGLLPALRFSRPSLIPLLKADAHGGSRRTIRVHRLAAMVQVGIAVPFLVVSGVMFDRVRTADLGFQTDGLAAARLPAPPETAPRDTGFFIQRVRDSLRQVGAVRSVAVAEGMPVDFNHRAFPVRAVSGAEFVRAHATRVSDGFLEAIGTPLLRGRPITAEDNRLAAPVAVISEPLAERLFPTTGGIGERVALTLDDDSEAEFTVVGVTADFATSQLTTERPQLLLPLPDHLASAVYVIARGAPGDERPLTAALENIVSELDVNAVPSAQGAFRGIVTGQDLLRKSQSDLIWESTVVAVAGSVILVLAALGIVGVVGFMVATRTHEFGVRMALGATRMRVFRMMLAGVVKLVIPGVAGGMLIGAVLIRLLDNVAGTPLTVGPTPLGLMEGVTYAVASAIAVSAALLAGLPAARRATSIQPMVALRSE